MTDHGTAIGWTHIPGYKGETWNPVTGCDRVSPGCAHCYALELASRLKRMGQPRYQKDGDPKMSGPGFGVTLHPDKLRDPLRWTKPRCVFVNSMSDLFHESIPDEFIAEVFAVMACAPQHLFLVLTKRPERMRDLLTDHNGWVTAAQEEATSWVKKPGRPFDDEDNYLFPAEHYHEFPAMPNIWLGVTIENRRFVDRADLLRETPAAVRFISAEPLLGPLVHDGEYMEPGTGARYGCWTDDAGSQEIGGRYGPEPSEDDSYVRNLLPELDLTNIDWLITGGESGPKHRRFDPQWATDLRDYCEREGVAFFHKQNGGPKPTSNGRVLDGRTYDQFPAVAA